MSNRRANIINAFSNLDYENVRAPYFFLAQPEKQLGIVSISWVKKAIIKRKGN